MKRFLRALLIAAVAVGLGGVARAASVAASVEVDDQEKVNVIGHDHAVRERRAGADRMNRAQNRERDLARRQKRGLARRIDEPREHRRTPLERQRNEEELPPAMTERHFHNAGIIP